MGKTLCLNLYPWRNQSWSPFPPISDVLCPLSSGISTWKPWMDQCQALLGGDESFTKGWALCSEKQSSGKQDFFSLPSAGTLPPCPSPKQHIIDPNISTHKKLCITDAGTALEQSPGLLPKEADKPKHPAPKERGCWEQHFPERGRERGHGRTSASSTLPIQSYPCCL